MRSVGSGGVAPPKLISAPAQLEAAIEKVDEAAPDLELADEARRRGRAGHLQPAAPLGFQAAAAHEHPSRQGDREIERQRQRVAWSPLAAIGAPSTPISSTLITATLGPV